METACSLPLFPKETFLPVLWWRVHPAGAHKHDLQLPQAEHEGLRCSPCWWRGGRHALGQGGWLLAREQGCVLQAQRLHSLRVLVRRS